MELKPKHPILKTLVIAFLAFMAHKVITEPNAPHLSRARSSLPIIVVIVIGGWISVFWSTWTNKHSLPCALYGSVVRSLIKVANS